MSKHQAPLNWYTGGGADTDVNETEEWLTAFEQVVEIEGRDRACFLLKKLLEKGYEKDVVLPFTGNTPYINTIPKSRSPPTGGTGRIERRIKSIVRWNAMAMVVRANKKFAGLGGHISTFASSATLYQVGFHHFFKGRGESGFDGDMIYFQGHGSPGIYAHAFLEGRIPIEKMEAFRRELAEGGGLSSYPHPWLMPDFWEFPTVSMGLGPISAIYQAKFNRYLRDRGLRDPQNRKVWAFLGDGETDEPETLGAITLASREKLDNLIFVINCNLQRLDGPVRGNGKIIQELETAFRGAGWNVIKVIWGSDWDPLDRGGQHRPADPAHDRGARRRVPEVRGGARLLRAPGVLRQVSGAPGAGQELFGRAASHPAARRPRSGQGLTPRSRPPWSTRARRR